MSTFLELCQTMRREAGISGTGPSSVVGQVGELERVVGWVSLEYKKLQSRHANWRFLRHGFTVNTTTSDDSYAYTDCTDTTTSTAISRFARWAVDEEWFKIYLTSAGVGTQGWLTYSPWDSFKTVFKIGTQNDGAPSFVSVDPARNLVLGSPPGGIYTVTGDYYRSPQILAADADTPEMPVQFHDLIWMGAMRRYAAFEGASEVWAEFKSQHSEMMRSLEQNQLPKPSFAPPLC